MHYRYARTGIHTFCIVALLGLFLSLSCTTSSRKKVVRRNWHSPSRIRKNDYCTSGRYNFYQAQGKSSTGYTWNCNLDSQVPLA